MRIRRFTATCVMTSKIIIYLCSCRMIAISRLFAEKCYKCKRPIVPVDGGKVAPKLRALGQDYHPDCFKCQVTCYFDFNDVVIDFFM